MATCTGKPTSTIFEDVTTVTAVPTETVTVIHGDPEESVITKATGTTVDCPSETGGGGRDDDDDSNDDYLTDEASTPSGDGLLGGLFGGDRLRRRGGQRLRRQADQCTTRTLYATLTSEGDLRDTTSTITTTFKSTIVTSTPVSTLYADCEESVSSSEDDETSSTKTSSSTSLSSAESESGGKRSSTTTSSSESSEDESSSGAASESESSKVSSSSREHASKETEFSTRLFTSTNSDGAVTSGMQTINLSGGASSSRTPDDEDDSNIGTYVGAGIGGVAGLLMLLVLARFMYRWCHKNPDDDIDDQAIEDWSASASHHSDMHSPTQLGDGISPRTLESFDDHGIAAASMKRSRSNTSSLERDLNMPPMQERPLPTVPEPFYPSQHPYSFSAPPHSMPSAARSEYASAATSSRYSQATFGSNAAGLGASPQQPPEQPVPPLPPMIKTTPPTEYQGSNRGSTVLVPRRSQLFDNTARAPELALAPALPTYSYKDDHEMLGETVGTPREQGQRGDSNDWPLHIANPSD